MSEWSLMDIPEGAADLSVSVMSNYDGSIDREVETQLRETPNRFTADYPGWNFHARVWFDGESFHGRVKQYHVHVATATAPTLEKLMEVISDRYGHD